MRQHRSLRTLFLTGVLAAGCGADSLPTQPSNPASMGGSVGIVVAAVSGDRTSPTVVTAQIRPAAGVVTIVNARLRVLDQQGAVFSETTIDDSRSASIANPLVLSTSLPRDWQGGGDVWVRYRTADGQLREMTTAFRISLR